MQTHPPDRRRGVLSHDEINQLRKQTDIEETISTAEAAGLLRYKSQTLRRWACQGDGPIRPRRVNGRLRWSVAEIRTLLAGV